MYMCVCTHVHMCMYIHTILTNNNKTVVQNDIEDSLLAR